MYENGKIYYGTCGRRARGACAQYVQPPRPDRGRERTGKTITMKVMAESFSDAGVPVFLCDVKGRCRGHLRPGVSSEGMEKRIDRFGCAAALLIRAIPMTFWDIYQTGGHAVRATVSDMGPELLSRILSLTPAQEGILHIMFRIADDRAAAP